MKHAFLAAVLATTWLALPAEAMYRHLWRSLLI
jgi:hypothetical protein